MKKTLASVIIVSIALASLTTFADEKRPEDGTKPKHEMSKECTDKILAATTEEQKKDAIETCKKDFVKRPLSEIREERKEKREELKDMKGATKEENRAAREKHRAEMKTLAEACKAKIDAATTDAGKEAIKKECRTERQADREALRENIRENNKEIFEKRKEMAKVLFGKKIEDIKALPADQKAIIKERWLKKIDKKLEKAEAKGKESIILRLEAEKALVEQI